MVGAATPRWIRVLACALLIPLADLAFDAGSAHMRTGEDRGTPWELSLAGTIAAFVLLSAPAYLLLPPDRFFRFFCALAVVGAGLSWALGECGFLLLAYGWHVALVPLLLVFTLAARRRYPDAYGPVPPAPPIEPGPVRTKPEA